MYHMATLVYFSYLELSISFVKKNKSTLNKFFLEKTKTWCPEKVNFADNHVFIFLKKKLFKALLFFFTKAIFANGKVSKTLTIYFVKKM